MNIPTDFIDYVFDFYGKGGIYDFGATKPMIITATTERMQKFPDTPFDADSVDRELIRDIMLGYEGAYETCKTTGWLTSMDL
jgi:hypothetical protein